MTTETIDFYSTSIKAPQQSGFAPRRHYEAGNQTTYILGIGPFMLSDHGQQQIELNGTSNLPKDGSKIQNGITPVKKLHSMSTITAGSKLLVNNTKIVTDTNGVAMKTPVSLLQEILSRRGITPNYELVQIEGAIHEPTFRYRVSFNDKDVPFTAMGAGRSKKEAKHAAARGLIEKLCGAQMATDSQTKINSNINGSSSSNVGSNNDNNNNSNNAGSVPGISTSNNCDTTNISGVGSGDGTDKVVGNPIGWLQEMCMSRRWPPPTYETETEVGLPHERLFTIACTILNFREVGKGKSKKNAKRMAAHKMWVRLQETPIDSNQMLDAVRSEMDIDKTYCDLREISVPILNSQHGNKVSHFYRSLKNSTGRTLMKLQKICLSNRHIDFVQLLNDIAQENQFEVTYVDIEELTNSEHYQCLVQISTMPVGVCHGSGSSPTEAQQQAAQNALEYLKIMTKK